MSKSTLSISKGHSHTWSPTNEITRPSKAGKRKAAAKTDMLVQESVFSGCMLGTVAGAILGAATGALTMNWNGVFTGFVLGLSLGTLTGSLIGAVTARTAGRTGGPAIGAYTGMGLGAILGAVVGLLIPNSIRMSANTLETPVLNALVSSRFETAALFFFLLCVLGTIVGVWVGGKNLTQASRNGFTAKTAKI